MSLIDSASLIVTPNAYSEGKLYSVIPSDGSGDMSVTRATTATRVNSAGLVELVPYNLVQYSEQFNNAYWTKNNTTITPNAITAPDGTQNADLLIPSAGTGDHYVLSDTVSAIVGEVITLSLFVKKKENDYFYFGTGGASAFGAVVYRFSTNTFTVSGLSATATDFGNGWIRLTITGTTGATDLRLLFTPTDSTGSRTYNANGTDGTYIWGAQAVEGTLPKDYQKTETRLNIPRLDYSNGTCPSLLVEPQRTNLLTYSSSFDNAAWTKSNTSVTANDIISPSGIQDADKITLTSGSSVKLFQSGLINQNGTYTQSIYVKAGTNNFIQLLVGADANPYCNFDILNGTYNATNSTATITNVGNGWFRCTMTYATTTGAYVYLWAVDSLSSARASSTTSSGYYYAWGFQLELGAYATSYIPTTSASVTRNADVISKTGISSLIGQTEGTLFVDVYRESLSSQISVFLSNSTGANAYYNSIYIYQIPNTILTIDCFVGNVGQFNIQTGAQLTVGRHKIAVAYKQNDAVVYIDGVLFGSDNSCNIPPMSVLDLNPIDTSVSNNAKFNAIAIYKTRLTNAELASLTSI